MWPHPRFLLKIVIFDHHGHVDDENFNFSKNNGPIKDFTQNGHFWPPWICQGLKFQLFQKCWPDQGFLSKLSFLTTTDISRLKISFVPINVARSKIFTQNCHFWPPRTCPVWKFQFFQKCWPDAGFCSKFLFLTAADMSRMKISIFPEMLARSRILFKIVIFDHCRHAEDENFNFSKNVGPT